MSGFGKRMRRAMLKSLAREQREKTAGYGQQRRSLRSWVLTTKLDIASVLREHQAKQREATDDASTPHE